MSRPECILKFKSEDDVAVALGFGGIGELRREFGTVEKAIDYYWRKSKVRVEVILKEVKK